MIDKLEGSARLVQLIRQICPDVVHALNYHSNGLARFARLFVRWRIPLVTSVYVEYTRKQLLYERLFGGSDTLTVCNSPQLQDQLCAAAPYRPTTLIYNGIDLVRFSPEDRSLETASVVFVGRISQQKAAHVLVEAVGILKQRGDLPPDFRAKLIGERAEAHAQQLIDEAVRRYQLADVVCQFPLTDHPEDYFRTSAVSVLPSLWEGLPNVVLESLACGCPVIVSTAANRAGVVQHGVTGWVVPTNDAEALAAALRGALTLPDEVRQQMSTACREAAFGFRRENDGAGI